LKNISEELQKFILKEHKELYSNPKFYCAHPHLAVTQSGSWVLIFNKSPRKEIILHPPSDFEFQNILMVSKNKGRTWLNKKRIINKHLKGFECAGLTPLYKNGLIINQWQFYWFDINKINKRQIKNSYSFKDFKKEFKLKSSDMQFQKNLKFDNIDFKKSIPKVRLGDQCLINILKNPFDKNFKTINLLTHPFSGGYGMRGGLVLKNKDIILPFSDVPNYKNIFLVRSKDNGLTWSKPQLVAEGKNKEFEEPSITVLPDGKLFMLLRENKSKILHSIFSENNGATWSKPKKTSLIGYPADLIVLNKNLLACVTGNRNKPYQILLYLSENFGES